MPTKLTQVVIESAKPKAARYELPDALVPGLRLVVQTSGAKSWAVRYRHGGAPKKVVLGPMAPTIDGAEPEPTMGAPLTLKGARQVARDQLRVLATGVDPAAQKRVAKRQAREEAADDRDLVRTVSDQFLERYLKPRAKPGYYASTKRILDKDVLPLWGGRKVQSITRRDVLDLLDGVVARGAAVQANRVLAAVRKLFAWAVSRDIINASPVVGVKAPTPEKSRDRVLTDDELRWLWLAGAEVAYPWGQFARTLILTGARRDEVAGMRRSEVSAEGTWTIPAERVKNGRAHVLPLPTQAVTTLSSVPRVLVPKADKDVPAHKGVRDLVFTTTGRSSVSGYHKGKERLDAAMLAIAQREAKERGEDPADVTVDPWTFHDVRRTLASGMAGLGIALPVVEKVLNHVSGSFGGIVGVYQRHEYAEEKRVALERWATHVEGLASGAPSNVTPMKHRRSRK